MNFNNRCKWCLIFNRFSLFSVWIVYQLYFNRKKYEFCFSVQQNNPITKAIHQSYMYTIFYSSYQLLNIIHFRNLIVLIIFSSPLYCKESKIFSETLSEHTFNASVKLKVLERKRTFNIMFYNSDTKAKCFFKIPIEKDTKCRRRLKM